MFLLTLHYQTSTDVETIQEVFNPLWEQLPRIIFSGSN